MARRFRTPNTAYETETVRYATSSLGVAVLLQMPDDVPCRAITKQGNAIARSVLDALADADDVASEWAELRGWGF